MNVAPLPGLGRSYEPSLNSLMLVCYVVSFPIDDTAADGRRVDECWSVRQAPILQLQLQKMLGGCNM